MKLDASSIKFHAVHRVGKKVQERTRPIIVRFVSREDRNAVWAKGDKIKQSDVHTDAYITEDFARAIQEERKVLIKAMTKAREDLGMDNVKVIGRYLIIDNQKYDFNNIPDFLKQPLS